MKRLTRTRALVAALLATVSSWAMPAVAARAEDPCDASPSGPKAAADVRGTTFTGTVIRARPSGDARQGITPWEVVIAVDHVYASGHGTGSTLGRRPVAGSQLRLLSNDCTKPGDLGLQVGRRYLVSYGPSAIKVQDPGSTVAWALAGDHVTLDRAIYNGSSIYWSALGAVRTLAEALTLVAPGELPATDAPDIARDARGNDEQLVGVGWALSLAAGAMTFVMLGRRRRGSPQA